MENILNTPNNKNVFDLYIPISKLTKNYIDPGLLLQTIMFHEIAKLKNSMRSRAIQKPNQHNQGHMLIGINHVDKSTVNYLKLKENSLPTSRRNPHFLVVFFANK